MSDTHQRTLRTILTGTAGWLALKDEKLAYQVVNPNFCQFLGKGPEEIVGRTDADLFPAEQAQGALAEGQAVLRNGIPRHAEQAYTGKEGAAWFSVHRAPILDDNGDPAGVILTAHDITAFKSREARVAEMEQHQATMRDEADGRIAQAEAAAAQAREQAQSLEERQRQLEAQLAEGDGAREAALEQARAAEQTLADQTATLEAANQRAVEAESRLRELEETAQLAHQLQEELRALTAEKASLEERIARAGALSGELSDLLKA